MIRVIFTKTLYNLQSEPMKISLPAPAPAVLTEQVFRKMYVFNFHRLVNALNDITLKI